MSCKPFYYKNQYYNSITEFAKKNDLCISSVYCRYLPYFDFVNTDYVINGKSFKTLREIADFYKINYAILLYEKKHHKDITECVEYLLHRKHCRGIYSKDFLGNEFSSASAMCEFWGISQSKLCKGLNEGLDIESILMGKTLAKKYKRLMTTKKNFTKEQYKEYLEKLKNGN